MQVCGVEVRPTTKWNDVDVDVDADTASSVVAVVKALLDRPRSDVQRSADCRLSTTYLPRRLTTICSCTTTVKILLEIHGAKDKYIMRFDDKQALYSQAS